MVQDNSLHTSLLDSLSNYNPKMPAPSRLALVRQLNQLVRELAEPVDLMAIHREQMLELAAIRSLMAMKVFNTIPEHGSISVADIAAKVNAEEALLLRLMKMVAASQVLIQLPDESFAHTKYSRSYAAPLGSWLDFKVVYDECFMPLSRLHLWMKEKGRIEPDCQETSPSMWMDGNEGKTFWEVMKADKERSDDFNLCMKVKGENSPKGAYYPFDTLVDTENPERTVLVDVGGGLGQTLLEVLKQCPTIKPAQLVLQDQPQVIAAAKASGTLPAEMQVSAYDYNDPQPVIGARGYMMRRVLHSYSDKKSIEVLKTLTPAMVPDSKLLISDFIVPEVASPDEIGSISASLAMMGQGGKERTITDFERVLEGAGLELTGVFRPQKGPFGVIEARLKPVV